MMVVFLLIASSILFLFALIYTIESLKEKEPRSPYFGMAAIAFSLFLFPLILFVPELRIPICLFFAAGGLFFTACLVPTKPNEKAAKGAMGYVVGEAGRFDERDIVFARLRLADEESPEQKECYRKYYKEMHPEKEKSDADRRAKGLLGKNGGGAIDQCHRPNVSMMHASFDMPDMLGPHAIAEPLPDHEKVMLDPIRATEITKGYAKHIGADLVGICKVNPLWVYSNRGEIHFNNWNDWGKEITGLPPYAVVMCTEMNWEHVSSAPHTPTVAESANDYAKGAYLSVFMARWFAHMGYKGIAQNTRRYDTLLSPLAVDAGLGEVGRNGYLIAPKYGARVRVFATLTDMPLVPDQPISLGAEEFCRKCKKCAESCPSKSIPLADPAITGGVEKWKLKEESCFDYWSKVGTDCSICMAVCPFSRPDTFSHRIVRFLVARSKIVKSLFPYMDNMIYGKKWKSRKVSSWLNYSDDSRKH